MSDIEKAISMTLAMLSTLSVSGDAVDVMAAARAKLKWVLAQLKQEGGDG